MNAMIAKQKVQIKSLQEKLRQKFQSKVNDEMQNGLARKWYD